VIDDTMMATGSAAGDDRVLQWTAPANGSITPGSEAHKIAFCRMLLDTHNPYKPAVLDWPTLDSEARARLVALPIWDIAVQTEGKASIRVLTYGESVADSLLREAVALNGFEEGRHKRVLSNLVEAYGIQLAPEPEYLPPPRPEWAFMVTGFSECIDSFFAFGLFALAKRSRFFPPELVDTFEPIMQEEARHILFFVNWVAWHRRNLRWWRRPWFCCRVAAVWVFLVWERIGLARGAAGASGGEPQDNNFTLTGSKAVANVDVSLSGLLGLCLEENGRRMAGYDPRLLRPRVMPLLVRAVRRLMPGSRRAAVAAP
jgi:hypothetical protein